MCPRYYLCRDQRSFFKGVIALVIAAVFRMDGHGSVWNGIWARLDWTELDWSRLIL